MWMGVCLAAAAASKAHPVAHTRTYLRCLLIPPPPHTHAQFPRRHAGGVVRGHAPHRRAAAALLHRCVRACIIEAGGLACAPPVVRRPAPAAPALILFLSSSLLFVSFYPSPAARSRTHARTRTCTHSHAHTHTFTSTRTCYAHAQQATRAASWGSKTCWRGQRRAGSRRRRTLSPAAASPLSGFLGGARGPQGWGEGRERERGRARLPSSRLLALAAGAWPQQQQQQRVASTLAPYDVGHTRTPLGSRPHPTPPRDAAPFGLSPSAAPTCTWSRS